MRILLALDGSDLAETAVTAVSRLPECANAEIRVLSVVDTDDVHGMSEHTPNTEFYAAPNTEPGHIPSVQPSQYGPPIAAAGDPPPRVVEDRGEALGRVRNQREDYIRGLIHDRLPGATDLQMLVDYADDPAELIVEQAQKLDVDFIAMATHGRSGLSRMIAGSVAEKVMRNSPVPVMLIGPKAQARLQAGV